MLCPYHKQQTIPLAILVIVGMGVLIMSFLARGFHPILFTLLPGFAFTIFCGICIVKKERKPWHRIIWKISLWWSGIWLGVFFFGFFTPLPLFGASFLLALPLGWAVACGINPFVAVGLHLLAWACSLDASKNEMLVGPE